MLLLSPMSVWSIGPVLEPEMVPENSGAADDHPLAFVGSLDVRYEKAVDPHWYARIQMLLGAK
jgi:hypothetical protein